MDRGPHSCGSQLHSLLPGGSPQSKCGLPLNGDGGNQTESEAEGGVLQRVKVSAELPRGQSIEV
eukprot:9177972-Pyramimonas_sp.AAC.1